MGSGLEGCGLGTGELWVRVLRAVGSGLEGCGFGAGGLWVRDWMTVGSGLEGCGLEPLPPNPNLNPNPNPNPNPNTNLQPATEPTSLHCTSVVCGQTLTLPRIRTRILPLTLTRILTLPLPLTLPRILALNLTLTLTGTRGPPRARRGAPSRQAAAAGGGLRFRRM